MAFANLFSLSSVLLMPGSAAKLQQNTCVYPTRYDSSMHFASMCHALQCHITQPHVLPDLVHCTGCNVHVPIRFCKHTCLVQDANPPSPSLVTAWMAALKQIMMVEATEPARSLSGIKAPAGQLVQALLTALSHLPADCATTVLESLADLALSRTPGRL